MSGVLAERLTAANIFDCGDLSNFIETITSILPFGGISMARLYNCIIGKTKFLTKVSFFAKSAPEIYNASNNKPHPEAEIMILTRLRNIFLANKITPCIVELVYGHRCNKVTMLAKNICKMDKLTDSAAKPSADLVKYLCDFNNMVKEGLAHDSMVFLVLERCDMTVSEFLRKHSSLPITYFIIKSMLFQIILTLTLIHDIYPNFKHYDLHSDNVMFKIDPNFVLDFSRPSYLIYKRKGLKYYVPYFGLIPKIIDFGHSVIPEEKIYSSAIDDKRHMYGRAGMDILLLLYDMRRTLASVSKNFAQYDELFSMIDPSNLYVEYDTNAIRNSGDSFESYEIMLELFDYRKSASDGKIYGKFSDSRLKEFRKTKK